MNSTKFKQLISVFLVIALSTVSCVSAMALEPIGVSPLKGAARFEDEFKAVNDNLAKLLDGLLGEEAQDNEAEDGNGNEDSNTSSNSNSQNSELYSGAVESLIDWITIIEDVYEKTGDTFSAFIKAEEQRNAPKTINNVGDLQYTKALIHSFIFGTTMTQGDKKAEVKGVFNRTNGRFNVETLTNLYFKDKTDMRLADSFDYVEGTNHLYLQFAYFDGYDEDREEYVYDVLRVNIGQGTIRMSLGGMTETKLKNNRVKSPFMSWEAFRLPYSDTFEFNGRQVMIRLDGVDLPVIGG